MNRRDAKIIAETITNEQLQTMFDVAKSEITNWKERSKVNQSLTKGTAWNILAYDFDVNKTHGNLAKVNMIREFGDHLPEDLKVVKPKKSEKGKAIHQEPKF